jgi:hypothetical protein
MRLLFSILLALVLVPAALADGPRAQTISGTISANSGSSITVTAGDRSVTCVIVGAKAQTALARWGVGAKATMACKKDGARLLLSRLSRLGTKEPTGTTPVTTRTTDDHGTTAPTPAPTPPPATTHRDAHGKVTALGGGTITVTRGDGTTLTCTITDGQARSIAEGAPVGTGVAVTCAGDGTVPALVNLQRIDTSPPAPTPPPTTTHSTTTTPPPTTTNPDRRYATGIVTALSSVDGVTVKPDAGGDSLHCRITPAADSTAAAAKLSLGAHVSIGCRRDGDSFVLAGASPVN